MLVKILVGAAVSVVIFLVVVALQPPTFHVERSITVNVPPERTFALVNDFHAWKAWSPWEARDPAMKRTYSGASSGAGAVYAWSGNRDVGEGRMTIESSRDPSLVSIKLEFLKPFVATNTATYSFAPVAGGTRVTWAMDGANAFLAKAFHLFVSVDRLVGADFERGLARMKSAAERTSGPDLAVANAH
jgi:hypothetical protein